MFYGQRRWMAATTLSASLIALLSLAGFSRAASPEPLWSTALERQIRFHALLDTDLLIAGTGRHLYAFDAATGSPRWRERNLSLSRQDLYKVPGSDLLLVTDRSGGAFDDLDTHVLALNAQDGELIWESSRIEGRAMQAVVSNDSETLYAASVTAAHGDDDGFLATPITGKGLGSGFYREPRLLALDMASGSSNWQVDFGEKVRMQPAGSGAYDERPFDLSSYRRPFVVDSLLCVTYTGVRCLNRFTGETVWNADFPVIEDDLALAYARPVVDDGILFATGNNRIYAFDLLTGKRLWRSKKANVLPEIQADETTVYSQLGGRFQHMEKDRMVWKGEYGAMAVDRRTGKTRWRFDNAKGSITNLHFESDRIWLADERRLYALNRLTGRVLFKAKHRMRSAPTFLVLNRSGQLVLIADDEVAAFDRLGVQLWSARHPAPGPGAWTRTSAQLFQLSGNLLRIASMAVSVAGGLLPAAPTIAGISVVSTKSVARTATRSAGNQLTAAGEQMAEAADYEALRNSYQYFLTTADGDESVHLAAVNINTGETTALIPLPSASPDIVIDDERGTLLQTSGDTITALRIR